MNTARKWASNSLALPPAPHGTPAGMILVRDTKNDGDGPVLRVSATDWKRLTTTIKG